MKRPLIINSEVFQDKRSAEQRRKSKVITMAFPLLVIPFILYNILEITGIIDSWRRLIFDFDMMSGANFSLNVTEAFTLFCIILLFVEMIKATRTSNQSIMDHLLSTIVFIICLVEFLLLDFAATPAFFLLTCISLIDVVAGYTITIKTASRDVNVGH